MLKLLTLIALATLSTQAHALTVAELKHALSDQAAVATLPKGEIISIDSDCSTDRMDGSYCANIVIQDRSGNATFEIQGSTFSDRVKVYK